MTLLLLRHRHDPLRSAFQYGLVLSKHRWRWERTPERSRLYNRRANLFGELVKNLLGGFPPIRPSPFFAST